jgi:predicted DNA-binding protein (MmcQ/YjbR family)
MKPKGYEQALARVRSFCLALPEAREVEAWGHPTFRAGKKMFAAFSSEAGEPSLSLKMSFDRQDHLLEGNRFFPTPYAARLGWVSLRIDRRIKWDEVRGLIEEAYREVALKRMLKSLDETQPQAPHAKPREGKTRLPRG